MAQFFPERQHWHSTISKVSGCFRWQSQDNPLGQRGGARESIEMEGGTASHSVTEGFDAAYARALDTADGNGVDIAGGASTVRQALNAGVIDEFTLDIAPVHLDNGERMLAGVATFGLEPVEVLHSPPSTHIRDRRGSPG